MEGGGLDRQIGEMRAEVRSMRESMDRVQRDLERGHDESQRAYVTKAEFEPVRRIVYGLVALALTLVAGAILSQVLVPT